MLGLDFSEILIIGVVALVVVGPKELPQLMRTVGRWVGKARRMASEFQSQMNEAIREAELDDVKRQVDDLRALSPKNLLAEQFSSVAQTLDEVKRETDGQIAGISAIATEPAGPAAPPVQTSPAAVAAPLDLAAAATVGAPPVDEPPAKPKRKRTPKKKAAPEDGTVGAEGAGEA